MTSSERDVDTMAWGDADGASAGTEQTRVDASQQPSGSSPSMEAPGLTLCRSYKEAKQLAATGRRSGNVETQHVRAVYLTSRQTWCVK
jgi:hypothetical protein